MNIRPAVDYFRSIEWSIGSGQCPSCWGGKPGVGWYPADVAGHKRDCKLAHALNGLGVHVDYDLLPKPKPGEDETLQRMWRAN